MPYPRPPRHRRRLDPRARAQLRCSIAASPRRAAFAGTYTVSGTCGSGTPYNADPAHIAVYGGCRTPDRAQRRRQLHHARPASAAAGASTAPPGRRHHRRGDLRTTPTAATAGRRRSLRRAALGYRLINCPGPELSRRRQLFNWRPFTAQRRLRAERAHALRRGTAAARTATLDGDLEIFGAAITIADASPPAVALTGGSLLGGWRAGSQTVSLDASDNVGIKIDPRLHRRGAPARQETERACNYGLKVPCPNGGATLDVPTGGLADGAHTVSAQAIDSAGNVGRQRRRDVLHRQHAAHAAARRHAR